MEMKVVLAGYRTWALHAFETLKIKYPQIEFIIVKNHDELLMFNDCIILCAGWSWIFKKNFIEKNKVICLMHPSDLPDYAGGSPIQNQVLDGVESTYATLFKADANIDSGPIFEKTCISLQGNISDIFVELERATVELFSNFIDCYPDVNYRQQNVKKIYKRITPNQSKVTKHTFTNMSAKQMYDFIRCRTNPYPNVYLEDETGRIYFEKVRFEKNE
jgi:methionyl-tRNA formyltransferase